MMRAPRALVFLFLFGSGGSAQRPVAEPVLMPPANAIVRAWQTNRLSTPRFYTGPLVSLTPDSVVLRSIQMGRPITLGLDSVVRLEYATGREPKTRNMLIGTGVGGVIGAPLFIGVAALAAASADSPTGIGTGDFVLVGTIGALVGAGAGALVGAMFPGRRTWEPISVPGRDRQ